MNDILHHDLTIHSREIDAVGKIRPRPPVTIQPPPPASLPNRLPTFADQLQTNLPFLRERLKLPWWMRDLLSDEPYARKDQAELSELERERFLCAFNMLNANGTLGQLIDIYTQMHMQHGTEQFLPWHRIYLLQLEHALRSIHPDVTIPYWDWNRPEEDGIPLWLRTVNPTVITPTRTITVIRSTGAAADLAMLASNERSIMAAHDFASFTYPLESISGGVHIWIGGTMAIITTAPADPIFWMHCAYIDFLWWQWQQSPQGIGKFPYLTGADAILAPWASAEIDTREIETLGYTYI